VPPTAEVTVGWMEDLAAVRGRDTSRNGRSGAGRSLLGVLSLARSGPAEGHSSTRARPRSGFARPHGSGG
jgi:hypothetical protein